jgi:hypothetical protein
MNHAGKVMRSWVIGLGGGVIALAVLWLLTAHPLSLLIDRAFTIPVARASSTPFGWNGVYLQFGAGDHILDLEGPGPSYPAVAVVTVDAQNRLSLSTHGQSLMLGARAGVLPTGETPPAPIPAYAAQPGDVTSLALTRSWLSWPVFEADFMTGNAPTWKRDMYYRLSWKKPSGARLDMLWRFEQGYYPQYGWLAPSETEDGLTGLIHAQITPAPAAH